MSNISFKDDFKITCLLVANGYSLGLLEFETAIEFSFYRYLINKEFYDPS